MVRKSFEQHVSEMLDWVFICIGCCDIRNISNALEECYWQKCHIGVAEMSQSREVRRAREAGGLA